MLKILYCCFFMLHFIIESRIQTAELNKFSVYLFVMESFPLVDSFVSKPGDNIIVWQMWFGVFFNGGHSWSIHVQTCWKPLNDDHKSKSDSLQKEICHRTFNQTLVWLRSGRIIVLWRRNTLTIHIRHLTMKISLLMVT